MPSKAFTPTHDEIVRACQRPLHPEAEEGIRLFNEGKYFVAHEAFENAWHIEQDPDRRLYQGILQAGIAYMHARNHYAKGVFSMAERCRVWLKPWPDHCRTIDIGKFRGDLERLVDEVRRLGPDGLDQLNPNLFTKIRRV